MNQNANTAEFGGASPMPAIGDVIAQKYRVDSVVGTGGMGVVLSATHLGLGQSVAIKVLSVPEDDTRRDEANERFLREGRATAALVSDHVVRVYDVGTLDTGAPFMVMELLRGKDLAATLQHNGALPIEHAADYVRQAAEAIACAHAQGIVHRDLKPSNLFLTQRSDGTPLIKVLDFGISKNTQHELAATTGNLTAARSVLGTPFYMSPEQVRDAKQVDFRTDIWSLGLILHELLSGSPAFGGSTLPGVCAAIAADPPAALRLKRPEVSVELEAIVLKCLEKQPNNRFQDVRDLAAVLAPYCGRSDHTALLPLSDRTVRSGPLTLGISARRDSPTVGLPPSHDGGTMPSTGLVQSGERLVEGKVQLNAGGSQTLSAAATTAPTLGQSGSKSRAAGSRFWMLGAALIAVLAIGAFELHGTSAAPPAAIVLVPPAPATLTPAAPNPSFSLEIAASQAGAQVYEGERLLGSTPLRMTVDSASVAGIPRTFRVQKPGFAPYTIVQGPSQHGVRVLAELSAEPAPSPPAAAKSKPKAAAPKAPRAKPKPASAPSDIFMQR